MRIGESPNAVGVTKYCSAVRRYQRTVRNFLCQRPDAADNSLNVNEVSLDLSVNYLAHHLTRLIKCQNLPPDSWLDDRLGMCLALSSLVEWHRFRFWSRGEPSNRRRDRRVWHLSWTTKKHQ
jgi:hypothetical protein